MNIFKHHDSNDLFGIDHMNSSTVIDLYSMAINYKAYLASITKLQDELLLQLAPGQSIKQVRENLASQQKTCEEIIELWNGVLNVGGLEKLKN